MKRSEKPRTNEARSACRECGGTGEVEEDAAGALGYVVKRPCRTCGRRPECKAADPFICEWSDCPVHGEPRMDTTTPEEPTREQLLRVFEAARVVVLGNQLENLTDAVEAITDAPPRYDKASAVSVDLTTPAKHWSDGGWGAEDARRILRTMLETETPPVKLRARDRYALAYLVTCSETAGSRELAEERLDERVRLLDEVCTWLASVGHKDAANAVHEGRDRFLLALAREAAGVSSDEKTVEPEVCEFTCILGPIDSGEVAKCERPKGHAGTHGLASPTEDDAVP